MSNEQRKPLQITPLALAGVVAVAGTGAFLLGKRSAGPETVVRADGQKPEARSQKPERSGHEEHHVADHSHAGGGACDHDHGAGEEHADEHDGVIRFSPEALAKASIRVEPVQAGAIRAHLPVTGVVEPNIGGLVKVTPRVAGKIASLRATIGDRVRAGQVLATMTSTELATAQAQYRQATARVSAARANLRRQRQLAGFGEFGQHKVQEARGGFNAAQGDLHEATADVNAVRNEIAQAEAALVAARSDEASSRSGVVVAEAAVSQAQSQVEVTTSRLRRQEALLQAELVSRQDWEQARADARKAEADLKAAQAAVGSAKEHVEAASAKVRQAQAVIETQRARLQQAQAKRVAAMERLTIAAEVLDREEKVYKSGVFASKEVADAEVALRHAEIERASAADAVRLLGGTPGGGNTLAIVAPLDGRITQRAVTAGETVAIEHTLFTVVNLDSVWVQLNIYPRDLASVRTGLPVTIRTEAVPGKEFAGRVAHVGDIVDETSRTVKVRCVIPNPGSLLKPDMFVRGMIATASRGSGIGVPREAVQTLEGKTVVFVPGEGPGEFEPREVRTGDTVDGRTVVRSGLAAGDRVVTQGAFMVKAQAMKSELGHSHAH
jgi:cobalt-zinc-cadmium efflux system membrane fusion protein